jgi:hypothetical protein
MKGSAKKRKIQPIRPEEVPKVKSDLIPDEVIDAFNDQITIDYRAATGKATIRHKDIIAMIKKKMPEVEKKEIIDKQWLDVEPIYEEFGWKVRYESPSYGDSDFEPYFVFEKKQVESE